MSGWTYSANRKKHQRKLNKILRDINKNIEQDDLWRGRFYAKQGNYSHFYRYEDGSGWELYVVIELRDRFTGQIHRIGESVNHWGMWHGSHMWEAMNEFIVERCSAWELTPRPGTPEYREMTDRYVREGWPH